MNIYAPIAEVIPGRPNAPAIVTPDGVVTFAALHDLVGRCAANLVQAGIRRGDLVGLHVSEDLPHLAVSLALIALGARQAIIGTSSFKTDIATYRDGFGMKLALVSQMPASDPSGLLRPVGEILKKVPPIALPVTGAGAPDASTPWLLRTSSGSTGVPKAFHLTHGETVLRWRRFCSAIPCLSHDRFFSFVPLAYGAAKQRAFYTLMQGGCVVLAPDESLTALLDLVSAQSVTRIYATPFHLECMRRERLAIRKPNAVRCLELSSAHIDEELRAYIRANITTELYNSYSVSEFGHISVADPLAQTRVANTIGFPVAGVECQVVDPQGRPLSAGMRGELRVRGASLIGGYLRDGGLVSPLRDGWFHPGDICEWSPDGQLVYHGRSDSMIVCRGINVSPLEVESTLRRHKSVTDAVCVPLQTRVDGQLPVAIVSTSAPASESELLAHCQSRLDSRGPRRIVVVDSVPRSKMGKAVRADIDRILESKFGASRDR